MPEATPTPSLSGQPGCGCCPGGSARCCPKFLLMACGLPLPWVETRLRNTTDGVTLWDFGDTIGVSDDDGKIAWDDETNPLCFDFGSPLKSYALDIAYSGRVDALRVWSSMSATPFSGRVLIIPSLPTGAGNSVPLGTSPQAVCQSTGRNLFTIDFHGTKTDAPTSGASEDCDPNRTYVNCCFCAEEDPYRVGHRLHDYVPTRRGPMLFTAGPLAVVLSPMSAGYGSLSGGGCVEWWGTASVSMPALPYALDWLGYPVCPPPGAIPRGDTPSSLVTSSIPVTVRLTCSSVDLWYPTCPLKCSPSPPGVPPDPSDCYSDDYITYGGTQNVMVSSTIPGPISQTVWAGMRNRSPYSGAVSSLSCPREGPIVVGGFISRRTYVRSYVAGYTLQVNRNYSPWGESYPWTASEI